MTRSHSKVAISLVLLLLVGSAEAPASSKLESETAPVEVVRRELASGCEGTKAGAFTGQLTVVAGELAAQYAENEAGFKALDADRVMRLRHPNFHTITPDGVTHTREQMYERTRQFIAHIEHFDCLTEIITALSLESDDTAHAVVDQRTVRRQRLPDGTLHDVRTGVVQRESWKKERGTWLLWRVDEIRDEITLLDGNPIR